MAKTRRQSSVRRRSRVVITLGELVAAAYEAVPGLGAERLERAKLLLTRLALGRSVSPRVEFVHET